jgi:hypothetical protein
MTAFILRASGQLREKHGVGFECLHRRIFASEFTLGVRRILQLDDQEAQHVVQKVQEVQAPESSIGWLHEFALARALEAFVLVLGPC